MRKFLETGGVAFAGLVTSILTAAVVTIFNLWTGFNLFTFSLWVIVPVGAIGCGLVAASGYYFAAKFLHQRPTKMLLLQMVVIAALTQSLIYWLEYKTLVIDGQNVSDYVPFLQYLDISLTKVHLKMGRALQADTGEVGSFGYWLAVFDFIGFMVGGAAVYFILLDQPTCEACNKYLKAALKKKDSFTHLEDFAPYYDNVYVNPVDSPEFAQHVRIEYSAGKADKGTINLTTTVFECPQCFGQAVQETVQVFNGREWKDVGELKRFVQMPNGIDVRPAFR